MDHLETEARNPASEHLDEMTARELVQLMNAEDGRVLPAVASQADVIGRAVEVIADRLRAGGRLIYLGAGTSGRLGVLDATECPPTFSTLPGLVVGLIAGGPPALTQAVEGAEDHPELAENDLTAIALSSGDVVVGIASSGRTPYVLGGMAYARRLGAFTIGLACNRKAELRLAVDLAIVTIVGPEVLSGSTRLKAGTATKLILNMLSTGAMVLLGKTYGNLMVDLKATNSKLRARTNRIVRQLTGLSEEKADALLQYCGGELKTALVVGLAGVPVDDARRCLQAEQGHLRRALHIARPAPTGPTPPRTMADLYLGIDGGGSHTTALLVRADQPANAPAPVWLVLGRGKAGPSNRHTVGSERALQALDEAVGRAFFSAHLPRSPVAAVCLGLAGAGRPEDREAVAAWAQRRGLGKKIEVRTDAELLLAAGTPAGWGVAVVAGTGSIAWACDADGRCSRAGGWGPLLGDEGSSYALAVAGLQAIVRAADGRGPATVLAERLLPRMGLRQAQELPAELAGGRWDRAALAALAPLIVEAAEADAVAASLLDQAARQLAETVAAAVGGMGWNDQAFPLALAGGLLLRDEGYRKRLLAHLQARGLKPDPVGLVDDPAQGAIVLALQCGESGAS